LDSGLAGNPRDGPQGPAARGRARMTTFLHWSVAC